MMALPDRNVMVIDPNAPVVAYRPSIFPAQLVRPGLGGTPACGAAGFHGRGAQTHGLRVRPDSSPIRQLDLILQAEPWR